MKPSFFDSSRSDPDDAQHLLSCFWVVLDVMLGSRMPEEKNCFASAPFAEGKKLVDSYVLDCCDWSPCAAPGHLAGWE